MLQQLRLLVYVFLIRREWRESRWKNLDYRGEPKMGLGFRKLSHQVHPQYGQHYSNYSVLKSYPSAFIQLPLVWVCCVRKQVTGAFFLTSRESPPLSADWLSSIGRIVLRIPCYWIVKKQCCNQYTLLSPPLTCFFAQSSSGYKMLHGVDLHMHLSVSRIFLLMAF